MHAHLFKYVTGIIGMVAMGLAWVLVPQGAAAGSGAPGRTQAATVAAVTSKATEATTPEPKRPARSLTIRNRAYLRECPWTRTVRRPGMINLACGDGTASLSRLAWTGWGSSTAKAKGSLRLNDCRPTCVAGKMHRYPVAVEASQLRRKGIGHAYTNLNVAFIGEKPSWYPGNMQVPLSR